MEELSVEGLLEPDERVIKRQEGVAARKMPTGCLCLTSKRLLFFAYKSGLLPWSPIPVKIAVPLAPPHIIIPLQSIKSVKKGLLGSLKLEADREYELNVGIWKASGWVDAILQACGHFPSSL